MIIAQVVLSNATEYERKCQRIDFAALSADYDVRLDKSSGADAVHTYGRHSVISTRRFVWRKLRFQRIVATPLKETESAFVPESVEDQYFERVDRRLDANRFVIGACARASVGNVIEQSMSRMHRFRDDVDWLLFDQPPAPAELRALHAWIDPAVDDDDFDGCVAEAVVAGIPVVASRTPINLQRLEQGRTGICVPPRDPNELTHAILAALFKPEVRDGKLSAARQTAAKFRSRQRAKALVQLYESMLR